MPRYSLRTLLLSLVTILPASELRADGDPKAVSYEKEIAPLFQQHCLSCHDGKKKKADFRIDVRSQAMKGGESEKPGIVPGQADKSEIYRRISTANSNERMPPKKTLTKNEQAAVKAWIDSGAKWPDSMSGEATAKHWAFVKPQRPEVPRIEGAKSDHPIDAFVLRRLKKEGLSPSAEADKITLCRRLYLDLIGLPPTPAQVDAFVADRSPQAYERLVDQLLASPHYGERWGRLWLDAARYADSDGFEKDKPRFVWFYRDWVINSLNKDLPYNQFIRDQIAGDLLPNPTQDQIVATGFLRNSMINEEGGVDPEQFRMEAMFDRMDAIGKGVLGLTIQCAQCHNHKFDPLSQTEYYQLFAYLNNAHESNVAVYTPDEQMKRQQIFEKIAEIEKSLQHRTPDWQKKLEEWSAKQKGNQPKWEILRPDLDTSGGQKHTLLDDGSIVASGYAPTKHTTDFTAKTSLTKITAVQLELLNEPSLPRNGPGRSIHGLFALTEMRVEIGGKAVKIASATSDAEPAEAPLDANFSDRSTRKRVTGPVAFAIDGKDETAWTIDVGPGRSNVPRKAVFVLEKPVTVPAGTKITMKLVQNHGGWNSDDNQNNNLGRFRFSVTDQADAKADPLPARARQIVEAIPAEKRTAGQNQILFRAWLPTVKEWKAENDAIEKQWQQHPAGTTQLSLRERDSTRATFLLKRGDFLKPGEPVKPGTPTFLHTPDKGLPANRLGLAMWLTDKDSPTTARAYVNRIWQAYFGQGLVTSPEDFGTQGEKPSHPELLDWLACEFMDKNWSIKKLHRMIVTSSTYRQSSKVTPELLSKDPGNHLLARGPRVRVDAEIVRDIALTASGLLNEKVGGPSVYPPIPGFLMLPPASYGPKVWTESTGPDRYRRSLYVFRFRSVPYPALQAFDSPNGDFSCVKRTRSNTPLQALTAMNEPMFVESAQALGRRVLREQIPDAARLTLAFRLCLSRKPTDEESRILLELLAKQREKFTAKDADPWAVAFSKAADYRELPNHATPADAAAWTTVARVLLNLDETVTKE